IEMFSFGVMICFEDIFPAIARKFVINGADFLVNMTNDAWFGDTCASKQHLIASVFRAVENKVPVIRSANTGISCFIDPFGRISGVIELNGKSNFVEGIQEQAIVTYPLKSLYTRFGDIFVLLCFIILCVYLGIKNGGKNG
ncbi:MAG: apolipoprotein N-acyltransferase, partial [Candidatus Omnitrophica bacterium]|nr:apolipoprotein N-acyltransferase [Candidatus Omnitrophota bacterium]